jgi:pimeloyl-ACP methyl ester carboxylesterase
MTTWVLLRGLMRERRHWGVFPAVLADSLPPGTTVLTPDLPGNGSLSGMDSPVSIAAMVAFCRAQLREQGHAPPYHLCALSLGGMVAVEWSARHPAEIAAAVLINTSMRPFSPFYRRLRWQNYGRLARLLCCAAPRQEALVLRLTSAMAAGGPGLLADWLRYRRDCPITRCNALRQLLAAARYRAPRRVPVPPLLVLAGAADRLVDPRCSRELADAWQTGRAVHPLAGHDLPLDDGQWVGAQIGAWLADSGRGRG